MKQIGPDKVCYYCYGCNLEELEDFQGRRNCKGLVPARDMAEFYKKLKEGKDQGNSQ